MDTYHQITEEPLTAEERKTLSKSLWGIPIFIGFASLVFGFLLTIAPGFIYVAFFFILIFGIIIFFKTRAIVLDLKDNAKQVVTGIVTKKSKYYKRGDRDSPGKWYYNLYFGEYRLEVHASIFRAFKEASLVEIKKAILGMEEAMPVNREGVGDILVSTGAPFWVG